MKTDKAKEILLQQNLSLAIVNGNMNVIYTSSEEGILPLVRLLLKDKQAINGLYAADRVIGRAAASLFIYGGIRGCFGSVMSEGAAEFFDEQGIEYSFDKKVPFIKNRADTDMCPMEKLVLGSLDYKECAERLFVFFKGRI